MIDEGTAIYCYTISGIDQPFVALARSPEEADRVLELPPDIECYRHLDITVTSVKVAPLVIFRPEVDPLTGKLGRCPLRRRCPEHPMVTHAEELAALRRAFEAIEAEVDAAEEAHAPVAIARLRAALAIAHAAPSVAVTAEVKAP